MTARGNRGACRPLAKPQVWLPYGRLSIFRSLGKDRKVPLAARFVAIAPERKPPVRRSMAILVPRPDPDRLLDHLIGSCQQRFRARPFEMERSSFIWCSLTTLMRDRMRSFVTLLFRHGASILGTSVHLGSLWGDLGVQFVENCFA